MLNDTKNKRAFNFDLIVEELKKYYKDGQPPKAYKDVEKYLLKNGFEHRQGSGYVSKDKLLNVEVIDIITDMNKEFSWLKNCIKKFDVTNVGEMYDLTNMFISSSNLEREKTQKQNIFRDDLRNTKKESMKEKMENAKNKAAEINKNQVPKKTKSYSIEER